MAVRALAATGVRLGGTLVGAYVADEEESASGVEALCVGPDSVLGQRGFLDGPRDARWLSDPGQRGRARRLVRVYAGRRPPRLGAADHQCPGSRGTRLHAISRCQRGRADEPAARGPGRWPAGADRAAAPADDGRRAARAADAGDRYDHRGRRRSPGHSRRRRP